MKGSEAPMKKIRERAFIQIVIIFLTLIIANLWKDPGMIELSAKAFLTVSIVFFIVMLVKVLKMKKDEQAAWAVNSFDDSLSVCITTVCKNEGETILNTVRHYMSFSDNVRFVLYDDHSTDGSFERLQEMMETYKGRLVLKKLKKRDIQIHPKAFAVEDAFNEIDCDYFLVIDSDTVISETDFNHAICAMINEKTDVLHITRRNNLKPCLPCQMGDKEELMNMGLQLLRLQPANFPGSGYFVRATLVRDFKYDEDSLSEDNYFLKAIKRKTDKIEFFLTLTASERAPETFGDFVKQRVNWLKLGIPYYLKQELSLMTLGNILFTLIFSALFNPFSPGLVFIASCTGVILGMQLAFAVALTHENPLKTLYHTLCYLLTIGYVLGFVYFWLQIMISAGKSRFAVKKNCMGENGV